MNSRAHARKNSDVFTLIVIVAGMLAAFAGAYYLGHGAVNDLQNFMQTLATPSNT